MINIDDIRRKELGPGALQRFGLPKGARSAAGPDQAFPETGATANVGRHDLVSGGSRVTYSVDGGPPQTGLVVPRARTGLDSGVIPVSSLLGATLMGMRAGQTSPLLGDDGATGSILVLSVKQSTPA